MIHDTFDTFIFIRPSFTTLFLSPPARNSDSSSTNTGNLRTVKICKSGVSFCRWVIEQGIHLLSHVFDDLWGNLWLYLNNTVFLNWLCKGDYSLRYTVASKQIVSGDNPIIDSAGQFSPDTLLSCPLLAYDTWSPSKTWRRGKVVATTACSVHFSPRPLPFSYTSAIFASASGSSTNTRHPAFSSGDTLTLGRGPTERGWFPPTQLEPPVKQHWN